MTYSSAIKYLVDVHCHPTDTEISESVMDALPIKVVAMSTRLQDQSQVADIASRWPDKVVPCFGYHPWFTHLISMQDPPPSKLNHYASLFLPDKPSESALDNADFAKLFRALPEPMSLAQVLSSIKENWEKFPHAMLGEVGLDRAFRIPYLPYYRSDGTPEEAEMAEGAGPRLSPFHVPLEHQLAILEAQIGLAIEQRRNISMHSVKAQQASFDLLKRLAERHGDSFYQISLDLHSCGLSAETWGDIQKLHSNVFISLSTVINKRTNAYEALIKACDPTRLLVESDYNTASETAPRTWSMLETVAEIRGWRVEQSAKEVEEPGGEAETGAVRRLMLNWEAFVKGGHQRVKPRESGKIRKRNKFPHAEEDWEEDDDELGTVVY